MSSEQLKRRLRAGLLVRLQPGVYAVPGAPPSYEQRALAACLAGGAGAAVSHRSAARLWGLRGAASPRVEITVPGTSGPRLAMSMVHRSRMLDAVDVRIHEGIAVTRPERTLVDVTAVVSTDAAIGMLESAVHLGLTTPDHIWRYLSRYGGPGCRGAGQLRTLLVARGPTARPTESALEDLALRVLFHAGAPPPVRQFVIRGPDGQVIRVDIAYPPVRLAIEVDSARWHSDSESFRRDRAKWNLLTSLGWTLIVVTDFDLHERPDRVGLEVVGAHHRLSRAA